MSKIKEAHLILKELGLPPAQQNQMSALAWETEVWIVEHPDHMIHFNGDKFLGPRI
jgi:hypothetical protein